MSDELFNNESELVKPDCRWWAGCDAPLCPLDPSVSKAVWYPGETICRRRQRPAWVGKQLKIAGRVKDSALFFTAETLTALSRVVRPKGIDPDKTPRKTAGTANKCFKTTSKPLGITIIDGGAGNSVSGGSDASDHHPIMKHAGGRPRKDGEVSRVTAWRREREASQGAMAI